MSRTLATRIWKEGNAVPAFKDSCPKKVMVMAVQAPHKGRFLQGNLSRMQGASTRGGLAFWNTVEWW